MEKETAAPVARPAGSPFMSGLSSGLSSGAVMMGIFWAVTSVLAFVFPPVQLLVPGLSIMLVLPLVSGLFSGVMNVKRAAQAQMQPMAERGTERTNDLTPMPVPMLMADKAPELATEQTSSRWTDRTGTRGNDRIQEILARGSISDKDRAAAILSAREQAANAEPSR